MLVQVATPPPPRILVVLAGVLIAIGIVSVACVRLSVEPVFVSKPWQLPSSPAGVEWPDMGPHEDSMQMALEAFPCGMYRRHEGQGDPAVVVHLTDDKRARPCGASERNFNGAATWLCTLGHAEIWIDRDVLAGWDTTESMIAFGHELGTSAGLDHDPWNSWSLMAPSAVRQAGNFGDGRILPRLRDADRDGLRERYCRR